MAEWSAVPWETYVPTFEGNRERYRRGEPHITVELRPPTAGVRRRYTAAIVQRTLELARATGKPAEEIALPPMDDAVEGPMFAACIRAIHGLTVDGIAVHDGAALWALRDDLDQHGFYVELWSAIRDRETLDAGSVRFLGSPGGSAAAATNGTAANAERPVSISRSDGTAWEPRAVTP